ncbi:MAG: Hsp70 family protein [Burkholderiaceae bacterium]|nr:Hsp70 family protein [Burkholderiaceae bacterium]
MAARYTVGIDLGTSHTVVAYADHANAATQGGLSVELLPIDQLVGPGQVAAQPLLPSVRYHPATGELPSAALVLPWPLSTEPTPVAGAVPAVMGCYARDLGARVPGRLVSSAKSWLSHPGVDRTAAILPWGAGDDVAKVSPVAASAGYLAHVRAAWNARFPDAALEQQDIVLTVPASFDEGARALTIEAAHLAGLPHLRLLEEPQAAFHDWLFRHRASLATQLEHSKLVLVCDIGGGTTDLTLIAVTGDDQAPELTRIGVGEHLMLGGDNMDLALARRMEPRFGESAPLTAARFAQLVQRCRAAKEQLLSSDAPESVGITLLGAGSRLVGAARSAQLTRQEVQDWLVDGFMPREDASARPQRRRSGIVEWGLPYPADPAMTRHLAAFLGRYDLPIPDTLLLNGGVFRSSVLAQRITDVLTDWRGGPIHVLHNDAPDVAVARGAVAHALVRAGRVSGLERGIGGGSARSYFLVLEDKKQCERGICILPRGTSEGVETHLKSHTFSLRLGQAVRFHLVSSVADTPWQAGDLVDLSNDFGSEDHFVRLPAISAVLPAPEGRRRVDVRVQLTASMTEVGTLEVHCVSTEDADQRWLLAFQLRGGIEADGSQAPPQHPIAQHPRLPDALQRIDRIFGTTVPPPDAKAVRQLRVHLEHFLGPRQDWDLPLLRALFDALLARARRRRRTAEHERVWLNLAGYCLRPGLGAALDAWRIEQLWEIFPQGIQYATESANWSEWWTLWRRAAAGLTQAQQLALLPSLVGHLEDVAAAPRAKSPLHGSYDDMVRLTAALEQIPAAHRIDVGHWLLERLQRSAENPQTWWAVGRIGARVPLYGSVHNVVPPESALVWLEVLLALDWKALEPAAFAAAQIARCSGDRARDLPLPLRQEVVRRLVAVRAPQSWITMVNEVVQLGEADQRRSFGEGLPPGLQLLG